MLHFSQSITFDSIDLPNWVILCVPSGVQNLVTEKFNPVLTIENTTCHNTKNKIL